MHFREMSGRMQVARFVTKHAVAGAVVVTGITAFTATCYVALLIWAALTGGAPGGPLALPFLIVLALVASIAAVGLILLPTTMLTESMCVKRRLRIALQIPLSVACLSAYVFSGALAITLIRRTSVAAASTTAGIVIVVLLIPLGAYWWSMQATDWILGWAVAWWSGRAPRSPR